MRRRLTALAVATACAVSIVSAPAQAAPAPAPMQQFTLTPAPGTALVFGSSAGDFVPSILASIAASVALTLLLNSGALSSDGGNTKISGSSNKELGSSASKTKDGESGSVAFKLTTTDNA